MENQQDKTKPIMANQNTSQNSNVNNHRLVYIVFFIVIFFVIAIIALVKLSPDKDTAGKAIEGIGCVDHDIDKADATLIGSSVEFDSNTYDDKCQNGKLVEFSCFDNVVSKNVYDCTYGCNGAGNACSEQIGCEPDESYCSEDLQNLISFSCNGIHQEKSVTKCAQGCNPEANKCN